MRPGPQLAAVFAALALSAGSASAQPSREAEEAALRRANADEVAAFLKASPDALAPLWADDFIVTNPLSRVASKADVLGMVRGGVLAFKAYDRRIEHIRRYGDIAIVIGGETVEWAGRMPAAGQVQQLRYTAVWKLEPAGWREVARHANVVPPP